MTPTRAATLTLLLSVASCANGGPAVSSFDGTYAGPFIMQLELSPQICPYSATGQAVMTIQGGEARIDVAEGTYFSGNVNAHGDLTLISGQGQLAFIGGRIVGGTYFGSGTGLCHYQVRLAKRAA